MICSFVPSFLACRGYVANAESISCTAKRGSNPPPIPNKTRDLWKRAQFGGRVSNRRRRGELQRGRFLGMGLNLRQEIPFKKPIRLYHQDQRHQKKHHSSRRERNTEPTIFHGQRRDDCGQTPGE